MRYAALILLTILFPACRTGRIDVYSCEDPCHTCEHPCDPCPTGECVELPPLGWQGPVLLWSGAPEAAPACPDRAPNLAYEGHDGLDREPTCPICTCGPSACQLSGLIANSAEGQCPAQGSTTPYPAPDNWNGTCLTAGTIPAAQVGSIEYPPLTEAPCEPHTGNVAEDGFTWARLALACQSTDLPVACDATTICRPTSEPPPPGFSQCLFKEGEQAECPLGYPERQVFYGDLDASSVSCSPCACSPPEGGVCVALVHAYDDAACSAEFDATAVGLSGPECVNTMAGFDLGSMSAGWMTNQPGTCTPSGGEPIGEPKPTEPATFCCQVKPND